MTESLSLGRIFGIRVGLNWSLLVVIALIAWTLATGSFPSSAPGYGAGAYWIAGLVAAVVFLASLLAHELAHSIVAQRRGVRVDGITLWLFGGVSRLSGEANSARAETLITVVGPLTSLVLGGLFLLAGAGLAGAGASKLVVATVNWIGAINLTLGIFNLLPAFPLDGGRILRALIWARSGDRSWRRALASIWRIRSRSQSMPKRSRITFSSFRSREHEAWFLRISERGTPVTSVVASPAPRLIFD